ncbi:zinc finger protein 654-like isoform X2 [Dunckerocampus dactyliophorus]|uniref:zinc finger protein 654-like isoform X2 n=1 Tax=Dunckerocampus dactyliophorus TaxID=161453 RepID=UPI002406D96C|nr:zinc finger protein 654-like isoform X2 [Dunckerocampus dactyliophorus]
MAEEGSVFELAGLDKQLQTLISRYSSDELRGNGNRFCLDYCKLVEEYASRWQVPLPRLRILEKALYHFTQASSSFTSSCDHVIHTLSSLALSVFELLLFFAEKDFPQEPLLRFRNTFQECHLALARYQNVHLLQVDHLIRAGGAWASQTLQAILMDACLSSELPVFFELRVRYLLSCERVSEGLALAKSCIRHPTAGQHLFFLQVYLTWLYKSSQHARLREELADLSGKDAVHIICALEYEETNELLLALCQVFLSQQLSRGDMYYICELVFVWSNLHNRLNTSKQAFLEESRQLMLSATNVNSIFPFIRVVLQELGEDGIQFCVELCANALKSCLPCNAITKSLIYKTIAGLLPNDLEVCRACALLVFFLERSVEAYKMVYLLYVLPDQEYHVEHSPIRNQIRFETLQVLKKDLYFDPEFWNLITLRTNCLKLMSKKVLDTALEEIMAETWVTNYCAKEFSSTSIGERDDHRAARKRNHKEGHSKESSVEEVSKRLKLRPLTDDSAAKKKSNHASPYAKKPSQPLRRSFWQLDRIHDVGYEQLRPATRLSEKNPPKRTIQKPKWLMEDSGTLQESKRKKQNQSSALRRPDSGQLKNNVKPKVSVNSCTTHEQQFDAASVKPASAPQVILELSLPDNELLGTFSEDTCNRQKGYPQMLLYKPTVKLPDPFQLVKVLHGKEVVLRARDAAMFVQHLHCYAQRHKGKGNGSNTHGSVSTITRSSAHGSPPKEPPRGLCEKSNGISSEQNNMSAKELTEEREIQEEAPSHKPVGITDSMFLCNTANSQSTDQTPHTVATSEEPSEMKVTFASQSPAAGKATQASINAQSSHTEGPEYTSPCLLSSTINIPHTGGGVALGNIDGEQQLRSLHSHSENGKKCTDKAEDAEMNATPKPCTHLNDLCTLETEMATKLPPVKLQDTENHRRPTASPTTSSTSVLQNKHNVPGASSRTVPDPATPESMQHKKEEERSAHVEEDDDDFEEVESEESKLEYCCTFCQKVFKGRHVVVHAMFHFRKDECMFCGSMFKDDLLAMMHLSDHIEKLKRSKESAMNKAEQDCVPETKDSCAPKSSAKAKVPNRTSGSHSSRRLRKSSVRSKSVTPPDGHFSEARCLRSTRKPGDQRTEHAAGKSPTHKVNGHIDKNNQPDQMKRATSKGEGKHAHPPQVTEAGERKANHNNAETFDSFVSTVPKKKPLECSKKDTVKVMQEKKAEPVDKVYCPADGCSWFTDLSKNRVALLYHALERHNGDSRPLELSFQVANSKCSICMRVLWSFEHFQHHVERHRLSPRHPCLHLGCTARFKTGMEMRRHTRKHSPLQAVCCLPGCSKLFICLWALNLHEKEHYASKPAKPIKSGDLQTENKPNSTKVKKTDEDKPKAVAATTEGTLSQATCTLRGHASHSSTETNTSVPPPDVKTSAVEQELEARKESEDANILNNLSNKESTTPSRNHGLNLRLRKWKTKKANLMVAKSSRIPFLGHRGKLRHRFKKKQVHVNTIAPRRRGRPPKSRKAAHDENTTAGKKAESLKGKTSLIPAAYLKATGSPTVGKLEMKEKHVSKADMPHHKAKSKKSLSESTESSQVEQNKASDKGYTGAFQNPVSTTEKSQNPVPTTEKSQNVKKHCASIDTDSSGASKAKKQKVTPRKSPLVESRVSVASKELAQPTLVAAGTSGDDKGKVEKTHSSQGSPADCLPGNTKQNVIKKKKSLSSQERLHRKKGGQKKAEAPDCLSLKRKSKEEPSDATGAGSGSTVPNVQPKNTKHSRSASKRSKSTAVQDRRNKAVKGLKKEGETKTAKKESPHPVQSISTQIATESKSEGKADTLESCAGEQGHVHKKCAVSRRHPSQKANQDEISTLCMDTLAEYGKKHMRAPPTVYLDEKYITMPKRRKEASSVRSSDANTSPVAASVATAPQRQRCVNCFTTFSGAEELQSHLRLQRCSSLFGFDSDDEGNS